ncbi:hypothetical protein [Streptomyces sp. NPDC001787]|uniref:hypothetical protein n=1 Tax=Streptomyces sp. NPDC001787 TaxID=3154523 RepID=UPI003328C9B2
MRIRLITSRTHRRHQEQAGQAARVPGLESDLANITTQLTFHREQTRKDRNRLRRESEQFEGLRRDFEGLHREHTELRQTMTEIVDVLANTPDAETARREAAHLLYQHFGSTEQLPAQQH